MVLPEVMEKVVKSLDNTIIPHDTVVDELQNLVKNENVKSKDLAIAMAVYMLGFSSYNGF